MDKKLFRSFARWPAGTHFGEQCDVTSDDHFTEAEANGVGDLLKQNGYGGNGRIFPLETWVIPLCPETGETHSFSAAKPTDRHLTCITCGLQQWDDHGKVVWVKH